MNTLAPIGRLLIIAGFILVIGGIFIAYGPRVPLIGRLPGDIYIKKGNFHFYFPVTSSIIISVIVTLVFLLISKITR
ncbi:MAG: DUF2905 domain-containing protein [bacterium]